jgi:hypothetical protein
MLSRGVVGTVDMIKLESIKFAGVSTENTRLNQEKGVEPQSAGGNLTASEAESDCKPWHLK